MTEIALSLSGIRVTCKSTIDKISINLTYHVLLQDWIIIIFLLTLDIQKQHQINSCGISKRLKLRGKKGFV